MEDIKPALKPIRMGSYDLPNRIGMTALTRCRADPENGVPTDLHVKYYSERASSAAFVLTECSPISAKSDCFPGSAGIFTEQQVEGWKKVTEAVHQQGGRIFLQIWHCGRAGLKQVIGGDPIAPSAIKNRHKARVNTEFFDYDTPIEMTEDDIKIVTEQFRKGAENAKRAGFDGIQLHGANGYLIDEFLRDGTNTRTDTFGGSIENRCRFPLQIIDSLIDVFGADKVGIKISPLGRLNDMFDSDPLKTYKYFLEQLSIRKVAFLEVMKSPEFKSVPNLYGISGEDQVSDIFSALKPYFNGTFIANNSLSFESANKLIEEGKADMVTFGRLFISNPDLVERFKNNQELTLPNEKLFYTKGPEGYTDYTKYDANKL